VLVKGSYASTVLRITLGLVPPTAYRMPFTAPTPGPFRSVAIGAFGVHVLVTGSYASTVLRTPLLEL
jgi:hypothetical protein